MSKGNIGLLTFHAAHNFGSVLQAYATKTTIDGFGYKCSTINYRFDEQDRYYAVLRFDGTLRQKLRSFALLKNYKQRKRKYDRFEHFARENLDLTKEVRSREELRLLPEFDTYLCGGDQLWNIHVQEINCNEDVAGIYYLDFISNVRKASFSTSIGNIKQEELNNHGHLLADFSFISTREKVAVGMIEEAVGGAIKPVEVIDPVFLLDCDEWGELIDPQPIISEPYVMLYTLGTRSAINNWGKVLKGFANNHSLKPVFVSTSFSPSGIQTLLDSGPLEFLNLYKNASVVIADTFHALCFAIIFRKPFYVLGNKYYKDDIRKVALLKKLGLLERLIDSEEDLLRIENYEIDYTEADKLVKSYASEAKCVLRLAIGADE